MIATDVTQQSSAAAEESAGETFPTLYLNRNIETARGNARRIYGGEAFGLFDLNPVMRPHLQVVELTPCRTDRRRYRRRFARVEVARDISGRYWMGYLSADWCARTSGMARWEFGHALRHFLGEKNLRSMRSRSRESDSESSSTSGTSARAGNLEKS